MKPFFDWVTEQVADDLLRLGVHGDVVLKSDQESARGLVEGGCTAWRFKAAHPETVSCGDSRGNGVTGRAIQSIEHLSEHQLYLERATSNNGYL